MTFPTIPTVAAGRVLFVNQANTTAARTFPDLSGLTKNSGDLLIAIVTTYQSTTNPQFTTWGGGFTEFSDQGSSTTAGIGLAYKWSTGAETGTFTVTQAATITGHASMCLLSIPLAHASTIPEAGTIANHATLPDPASFNPTGWDIEDTLWIAVDVNGMTSATGSWTACGAGTLTNYTDLANSNTTDSSTIGQTEVAVSFRQVAAAAEDRGAVSTHDTTNARASALIIAVRPAPATQALTPSLFTSATFAAYAAAVTVGAVNLAPSLFENSNTFYAPTVAHVFPSQDLTPSLVTNTNTFYAPTVASTYALTPSLVTNSQAFHDPTVTPGAVDLTPSLYSNTPAFYAPTVTVGAVDLTPSLYSNSQMFYAASVSIGGSVAAATKRQIVLWKHRKVSSFS